MLKISKMARKLDPHAAVLSFLQNRPLLQRLVEVNNALTQRDKPLLQSILQRGTEPSGLIQAIDEVMKANSLAKKYQVLAADLLLVRMAPAAEKLQEVLRGGSAEQLLRTCTEEIPKLTQCLTQLALAPAVRAQITSCLLQIPSGGGIAGEQDPTGVAATRIHCEALLRIVMTLVMSARDCRGAQDGSRGIGSGIVSVVRAPAAPISSVGVALH